MTDSWWQQMKAIEIKREAEVKAKEEALALKATEFYERWADQEFGSVIDLIYEVLGGENMPHQSAEEILAREHDRLALHTHSKRIRSGAQTPSEKRAISAIASVITLSLLPSNSVLKAGYEAMFNEKWDGSQAPMMGACYEAMVKAQAIKDEKCP